ncbi:hypothetical protein JCM10213_008137 [Rhodosporidiobolus nylandii]
MSTSYPNASSASSPAIASASTSVNAFAFSNAKVLGQEEDEDEKPRVKEEEDEAYLLSSFSRRDKGVKREDAPSPAPDNDIAVKLDDDEHDKPPVKEEEDAKPLVKEDDDDRATLSRREEGIKRETAPSPAPEHDISVKTNDEPPKEPVLPPRPTGLEDVELTDADLEVYAGERPGPVAFNVIKAAKLAGGRWDKVETSGECSFGDDVFSYYEACSVAFETHAEFKLWQAVDDARLLDSYNFPRRAYKAYPGMRLLRLSPPPTTFLGMRFFKERKERPDKAPPRTPSPTERELRAKRRATEQEVKGLQDAA